jgi:hypothetical protein
VSDDTPAPEEQKPEDVPPTPSPPKEPQSLEDTEADIKEFFGSQEAPGEKRPNAGRRPKGD